MLAPLVLVALQAAGEGTHDLVIRGRVFTADLGQPRAEALAVRGKEIVALGTWEEVRQGVGPETRVVDAGTGSVVPGFNDAHAHFTVAYGMEQDVDLEGARTLDEILARVEDFASDHPDAAAIEGGCGTWPTSRAIASLLPPTSTVPSTTGPSSSGARVRTGSG